MTDPHIHGKRGFVSASKIMATMGESLRAIKEADKLTYGDVGQAIGRSDDQASKYCEGTAMMPADAFLRACDRWNGRFANPVYALFGLHLHEAGKVDASALQQQLFTLMDLTPAVARALADGDLSDGEIIDMQPMFEVVGQMIDGLRARYAAAMAARAEMRVVA
jgi:hypothetical protein